MLTKVHADDPGLMRLVEKQLRRWEIASSQQPAEEAQTRSEVHNFITLSNQVGARGDEVAALLGAKLDWPVFDKDILQIMAGNNEVRARLYASRDERDLGWFEETFRSLMQEEFRRNDYFHRLTETIMLLARQAPAIFRGRGADLILPRHTGLRVKIIAPREERIEHLAEQKGLSREAAVTEIERIERDRREFIRRHFRENAEEPTRFDLLINMRRSTVEDTVSLIQSALALLAVHERA